MTSAFSLNNVIIGDKPVLIGNVSIGSLVMNNSPDVDIFVAASTNVDEASGIRLAGYGSVTWNQNTPLWAVCLPGTTATLTVTPLATSPSYPMSGANALMNTGVAVKPVLNLLASGLNLGSGTEYYILNDFLNDGSDTNLNIPTTNVNTIVLSFKNWGLTGASLLINPVDKASDGNYYNQSGPTIGVSLGAGQFTTVFLPNTAETYQLYFSSGVSDIETYVYATSSTFNQQIIKDSVAPLIMTRGNALTVTTLLNSATPFFSSYSDGSLIFGAPLKNMTPTGRVLMDYDMTLAINASALTADADLYLGICAYTSANNGTQLITPLNHFSVTTATTSIDFKDRLETIIPEGTFDRDPSNHYLGIYGIAFSTVASKNIVITPSRVMLTANELSNVNQ